MIKVRKALVNKPISPIYIIAIAIALLIACKSFNYGDSSLDETMQNSGQTTPFLKL